MDDLGLIPVFVYGTLKRGECNHHWLRAAEGLGEQRLRGLCLYDLGPFPMAMAPDPPQPSAVVVGELYWVDATTLEQLDRLEGVPRLYQRHWLTLESGTQAWVYLGQARQVRHVAKLVDGCWHGSANHRHRHGPPPRV